MRIGVVFPQTEIGQDPAMIREYAQAVEAMGYIHILAFDSVIGANPDRPGGWDSQYDYRHAFHEPFALFAFCAAVTRRIELATGVLILPQRQTTLVAKQAAEVDVLSGGRLRLGVGVGWNPVGIEGRVALAKLPPAEWAEELAAWRAMRGITHVCVNTMGLGLPGPEEHVRVLERFMSDLEG